CRFNANRYYREWVGGCFWFRFVDGFRVNIDFDSRHYCGAFILETKTMEEYCITGCDDWFRDIYLCTIVYYLMGASCFEGVMSENKVCLAKFCFFERKYSVLSEIINYVFLERK